MNNLLNALGLDKATQEKLPPNIMQGATIIEGLQSIYSNAPESPKKDILASTIAESVRLLMKEINTFINAGMPEQEPEQVEHKEPTPPQEDDNEPTPQKEKAKVKFIKISWTGEEFDTWAKFQNYLIDVYLEWTINGTKGGYEKIKFEVEWENGKRMVDRVDVGDNQGDFNPRNEIIGSYLEKQNQAMYESNFEGNERREIVSWKDSEEQEQEPKEDDNEPTNTNKWRLPTIKEFKNILYPNKDLIPNLIKRNYYWSSSDNNDNAWFFGFGNGLASATNKTNAFRVRAIRDISSNSTDSENWVVIGNLEVWNEDLGTMNWDDAVAEVEKLNNTQDTEPTPPTPPTPPKPKGKKPKPPTPPKPPKKRKPEEEHIPQDDYENMDEEELATMLSELEDLLVVLDENDSEYQEVKKEIAKIKQYIN